jgi:amino acid transporter
MMFFGGASGRRNLPQHPAQRKLLLFWCWLYLSMGVMSAAVGILVLTNSSLFAGGRVVHLDGGIVTIAAILILFGVLRVANSVFHIRRLSRMR